VVRRILNRGEADKKEGTLLVERHKPEESKRNKLKEVILKNVFGIYAAPRYFHEKNNGEQDSGRP